MSLKSVHIAFITIATILMAGFGWWSFNHFYAGFGIVSLIIAVMLIIYLFWFLKKIKKLNGAL